jgi:glutamine synthetase
MGLSEKGYHFIGGLKKHAKSYIAVTAPTVGSYKRLVIGAPTSGATWAPAYVTYGWNNRTMMLRIPDHGRIEDRTVDGACNPYLAATVVLAAGLDGIENGIDPGDPSEGSMYETSVEDRKKMGVETLPANLLDATRELEQNEVMRKALGNTGNEDYVDYFVRCKQREWQLAHEQITKWEIDRYLQLS